MKCSVKDCENNSYQGDFIGLLCGPCHDFIAGGDGIYSQAYRNMRSAIDTAVAKEREACAELCEHFGGMNDGYSCASAIRARNYQ